MNKMVRQQLFITAEQKRRIKTRAALTGMSEGEIIRRGINRELEQETSSSDSEGKGDSKEAWRQAAGMWKDRDDVEEFYANRRKRDNQRMDSIRKRMRGK